MERFVLCECVMCRLYKYSKCSVECLVLGLIYIDRFIQSSDIQVNSLTVHRILLTRWVARSPFHG